MGTQCASHKFSYSYRDTHSGEKFNVRESAAMEKHKPDQTGPGQAKP